jgi:hypothetical protein
LIRLLYDDKIKRQGLKLTLIPRRYRAKGSRLSMTKPFEAITKDAVRLLDDNPSCDDQRGLGFAFPKLVRGNKEGDLIACCRRSHGQWDISFHGRLASSDCPASQGVRHSHILPTVHSWKLGSSPDDVRSLSWRLSQLWHHLSQLQMCNARAERFGWNNSRPRDQRRVAVRFPARRQDRKAGKENVGTSILRFLNIEP